MRHQKKGHKLGRTASHRKATLAALSSALIEHKRITTTVAKAKALRPFVEPLITRAKDDTTHNRRQVFRRLQNKQAITELFGDVSEQVADRSGGYTRVIKLGRRFGDGTEMAMVELVDYNDVQPEGSSSGGGRTRRGGGKGRRRKKKQTKAAAPADETTPEEKPSAEAQDVAPEEETGTEAEVESQDTAPEDETTAEASAAAEQEEEVAAEEETAEADEEKQQSASKAEAAEDEGEAKPEEGKAAKVEKKEDKKK